MKIKQAKILNLSGVSKVLGIGYTDNVILSNDNFLQLSKAYPESLKKSNLKIFFSSKAKNPKLSECDVYVPKFTASWECESVFDLNAKYANTDMTIRDVLKCIANGCTQLYNNEIDSDIDYNQFCACLDESDYFKHYNWEILFGEYNEDNNIQGQAEPISLEYICDPYGNISKDLLQVKDSCFICEDPDAERLLRTSDRPVMDYDTFVSIIDKIYAGDPSLYNIDSKKVLWSCILSNDIMSCPTQILCIWEAMKETGMYVHTNDLKSFKICGCKFSNYIFDIENYISGIKISDKYKPLAFSCWNYFCDKHLTYIKPKFLK